MHSDVETSVGAHQIFALILFPSSLHSRVVSLRSGCLDQHNKRHCHTTSASASISALLEKLRRGKHSANPENHGNAVHDECKERDIVAEDWKQGCGSKNSPNFYKLSSITDRTAGLPSLTEAVIKLISFN